MSPAHYARMALRESRRSRGRIALFCGCIAVGVAAVVVVTGLAAGIQEGTRSEGRRLLAADVAVEGRRGLPPQLDEILARFAADSGWPAGSIARTDLREFVSVVLSDDGRSSQLAELKAVHGEYPFYGGLRLDPPRALTELLAPDTVVVAPELLQRVGASVGGKLRVGGADYRIAGTVLEEPDKLSISFTLGPRVFLSDEGLARTALLGRGSRVEHRALIKLPPAATARDAERLEQRLRESLGEEAYRIRTFQDAHPALRRSFERVGRYLGLVGLLSLLIGGVGVAQVARAWLAARMDDIAVLRCVGATPREVVTLYLAQVVTISLAASLAGALLGTGLHALVPHVLPGLVPADLVRPWQPAAVARGTLMGVAVALLFTLPLLVGLRRVPPARVLRRDAEPFEGGRLEAALGAILVIAGVWAAAATQSESLLYGTWFTGGLVAAIAILAGAAWAVSRAARLLPRDAGGVRLRHGLAHLARPGAATVGAIVAIGLGVTFVFATWLVERHLGEQLRAELPADAPSTFFVDIQPDQWLRVEQILKDSGAKSVEMRPIVTARFAAIEGVPVSQLVEQRRGEGPRRRERRDDDRRGRSPTWALTREQRLTYGNALPKGNRVTAGAFPASAKVPNGVSVEEGFARDLGVRVGSKLTLDVQGVNVDLVVTSLRTVDWRTMGMNFFLFAEPGPLDDAPQMRLATARIPTGDLPRVQSAVVAAFPNVTVVHVRDVMDKVLKVLANIGLAVRLLGTFTVVAGVVVLGGTVAATQARRAREVALLKTVGMTRRDVIMVFAVEYALTGTVAAMVGIAAACLLAWAALTRLMDVDWAPRPLELACALGATITLAVAAGLMASARALSAKPLEVLRAE